MEREGRVHHVVGLADYRHRGSFGLADLLGDIHIRHGGPRPGNVTRLSLPVGPRDEVRECLRAAPLLVEQGDDRIAMLALVHNVYRGQVVSFGHSMFGERSSLLRFHERPQMTAEDLILPAATFDDVRRQVVGVARNSDRLRASGQYLKRGLLLYGPPGVGKTHTVRYLVSELTDTTIVELTGETLGGIREACSIARTLQPSMIVVEDVDLIAQQRDHYQWGRPRCSSRC